MKITYTNHSTKFTIVSALMPDKQVTFKLRKSKDQVEAVRERLEEGLEWLENEIVKCDISESDLLNEFKRRARITFRRVLAGARLIKVTETITTKVAKGLNERGQNDYYVVHQESISRLEWRQ